MRKKEILLHINRNDICRGKDATGYRLSNINGMPRWHIDYTISILYIHPTYYAGTEHHDDDCWNSKPEKSGFPDHYCLELYAPDLDNALAILIEKFRRIERACKRAQSEMEKVTDSMTFEVKIKVTAVSSRDAMVGDWRSKINPIYIKD